MAPKQVLSVRVSPRVRAQLADKARECEVPTGTLIRETLTAIADGDLAFARKALSVAGTRCFPRLDPQRLAEESTRIVALSETASVAELRSLLGLEDDAGREEILGAVRATLDAEGIADPQSELSARSRTEMRGLVAGLKSDLKALRTDAAVKSLSRDELAACERKGIKPAEYIARKRAAVRRV